MRNWIRSMTGRMEEWSVWKTFLKGWGCLVEFKEIEASFKIRNGVTQVDQKSLQKSIPSSPWSRTNSGQSRNDGNLVYRNGQFFMVLKKHRKNDDSTNHFSKYLGCPGYYANCLVYVTHKILITMKKKRFPLILQIKKPMNG